MRVPLLSDAQVGTANVLATERAPTRPPAAAAANRVVKCRPSRKSGSWLQQYSGRWIQVSEKPLFELSEKVLSGVSVALLAGTTAGYQGVFAQFLDS